jgi:hypothetical protein
MSLQEADFSMTQRAMEGRSADDRLMIKFELFPHPNEIKSLEAGHPVYDDKEFITIIVPGDKTSIIHRPVWAQDKERFARQYAQFKQGLEQTVVGLPLKLWGGMTLGQAKEFEYFNVKTVEQLSEMSDGNGIAIQGFNGLKQRAKDYVAQTKEQQPLMEMRAELEKKDSELSALTQSFSELSGQVQQLMKMIPKAKLREVFGEEAPAAA